MSAQFHEFRSIPLTAIALSQTAAQRERRAAFDKGALAELAASIKSAGVIEPILVRQLTDGPSAKGFSYELVAGERRFVASRQAGLEEIPANVRELSDQEVIELQLIENLQREDMPEIAEAEGYEALSKYGYTADQMAAKVGKSRGTVYARMKLLALEPEARKAMKAGELTASVALLIARIPDRKLQLQALKEVLKDNNAWGDDRGQPMSYRHAAEHVQEHYMLKLSGAPFPTSRDDLVPAAGSCSYCPKNTACRDPKSEAVYANLELFADVKGAQAGAGVCTDPTCYQLKARAWAKIAVAQAKDNGRKVIEGPAALQILKHGTQYLAGDYKRLDQPCYDDSKQRNYQTVLGKRAEEVAVLIVHPETGEIVQAVKPAAVREVLKDRGVKVAEDDDSHDYRAQQRKAEAKRKGEIEYRRRLLTAVMEKAPKRLDQELLCVVAITMFGRLSDEASKALFARHEWKPKETRSWSGDPHKLAFEGQVANMTEAELSQVLVELAMVDEIQVSTYGPSDGKPNRMLRLARHLGVKPDPIRKAVVDEIKEKRKAKKAAKP
ncbi:MAG TPA: ParB/RepB/Spo0J family partition protein [Steroidobacteraceae bacterium]|nr:ParB/RepB/Spo0J family partition protein [Steroidobacteraceae bacterium]